MTTSHDIARDIVRRAQAIVDLRERIERGENVIALRGRRPAWIDFEAALMCQRFVRPTGACPAPGRGGSRSGPVAGAMAHHRAPR